MPSPGMVVRLRPMGPWRIGPNTGSREQTEAVLHSDSLYSAISCAMQQLGFLTHWLSVTAESDQPEVRITSAFPFSQQNLFVPPPRHTWPPSAVGKVRWKAARLVPLSLTPSLLREEEVDQERWAVDPVSGCLLPAGKHGASSPPFRIGLRSTAPVDRLSHTSHESFASACLEFTPGSGMWCLVAFANERARDGWAGKLRSAFRLLADSGFGGERSRGWGRSKPPQFQDVDIEQLIPRVQTEGAETGYWMLSLYSAGTGDRVNWNRGDYTVVTRSGRANSNGMLKRQSRMLEEGSVVFAGDAPTGRAIDVAPEGSAHPVYRWGVAAAFPVPVKPHGVKYRLVIAVPEPEPESEAAPPPEPEPISEPEFEAPEIVSGEPSLEEDWLPEDDLLPEEESLPQETPVAGETPAAEQLAGEAPASEGQAQEVLDVEPPVSDTPEAGASPADAPVEEPPGNEPPIEQPPSPEVPLEEPPPDRPTEEEPPREEPPGTETPVEEPPRDSEEPRS
jgi:CRISPR type III-A-associated RAMP protein Csm4